MTEQTKETTKNELVKYLPEEMQAELVGYEKPTAEGMLQASEELSDEYREKLGLMLAKSSGSKPGMRTSSNKFTPAEIKIYHGTGSDDKRPSSTRPGEFYSTEGRVLGDTVYLTPIHMYEDRSMFGPREGGSNLPICWSLDRKVGTQFGSCNGCANEPWAHGHATDCKDGLVIHFVDQDFTGIYMMRFTKSALKAGNTIRRLVERDPVIWSRFFKITLQEREANGNRWFAPKAQATEDNTPDEVKPLLENFMRMVDHDVYLPRLNDVYRRAAEGGDAAEETDENDLFGDDDSGAEFGDSTL